MNKRFTLPTLLFMSALVALVVLVTWANTPQPVTVRNLPVSTTTSRPAKSRPAKAGTAKPASAKSTAPKSSAVLRRPVMPPGERSVKAVVDSFAAVAKDRYAAACRRNGLTWPPEQLTLVAFKRERVLEVWAAGAEDGVFKRIATHKILGASGGPGPKRQQGDMQVPEGFYNLTELNPNSIAHLSVRIDYPNATDIGNSAVKRDEMGGDIYVHGHWLSHGCLAIGDRAIEELFPLIAMAKPGNRRIIIAPFDFRRNAKAAYPREEPWVHAMYNRVKQALKSFPAN